MCDIKTTDSLYIENTYSRFPVTLVKGKGSLLYDENGKEYIDLGSGIAVNIFGACDDEWLSAVTEQASTLQHTSNLYFTAPCANLAKELCERTGMKKVFFSNSGAEANEAAIKAARRWSLLNKGEGHSTIITLKNSFHGRTVTTLSATGQDGYHTNFMPFTEGFVHADPANPGELDKLTEENNCCAIMMEMIQGEGGVCPLSDEFVKKAVKVAEEKELLLIVDEVQTGNGRTGKLYSYMNFGFTPDIVSTAKGLAGGLPMGCTMFGERVQGTLIPGTHGSTFGGNPVCAAGALSVIKRIDDKLLCDVQRKSDYIRSRLEGAKGVTGVSGMGLMLGIECTRPAKDVLLECMDKGVLVLTAKTRVRLLPALNIPDELLEKAMDILTEVLGA